MFGIDQIQPKTQVTSLLPSRIVATASWREELDILMLLWVTRVEPNIGELLRRTSSTKAKICV